MFSNFVDHINWICKNLMEIEEFVERINQFIPFQVGFEEDKLGIQIHTNRANIEKVLIAYEVTLDVVTEAIQLDANLIVSFHPLIYNPLETIIADNRVGIIVSELIRNSISLVVCHTNFDAFKGGTSWLFAERLGLANLDFLVPNDKYPGFGFGVIGNFESPINELEMLEKVQELTYSPLRWCKGRTDELRKVAIVGGSGMSFAKNAFDSKSDVFITADIKYHSFHEYNGRMMLIDPGHWEMEYLVPWGLRNLFLEIFKQEVKIFVSNVYTNPIKYFLKGNVIETQRMLVLNKEGRR